MTWLPALMFLMLISQSEAKKLNQLPKEEFLEAKKYLESHSGDFSNKNYLALIDYSLQSNNERFFLIDLMSGNYESHLVAHGKGSDPKHSGRAEIFGDEKGSNKTSLGFFKTGETYTGIHGLSLRLTGLSPSNRNAFERAIVIHGASYVHSKRKTLGRSWGCPALDKKIAKAVIEKLKNGALLYSFSKK